DICIYDISTDVMWKIELPEIKFPYTLGNKFSNAFCVDSRIFFLPFCSSDMLVVDTKCWELSVHKILDTEENWIGGELSSGGYILHRDKCYIASARSNEILEIDINTYKVRRYRLGNEDTWYGSISFDGKNIWLTGGKNTITKWDMIRNIVEEYDYPEYFVKKQGGYPFLSSFQWQDKIILIPRCANMFVIINTETNNINGIQSGYEEISFLLDGNKNQAVLYDNTRWKLFFTDRNHTKAVQIKMESYIKYWIYEVVNNKVGDKGFIDYKQSLCGNKIYSRCKEVYL
ncbi:MAG: hypothetical protein K2N34_12720, partial [Lachnospiraceae bacterium]|nr:hypothetical protein [Lachnospiraceae bacterium]